jgi:hypothetical protein
MHVEIAKGKQAQGGVEAYDGVAVVVDVAFEHPVPVVHVFVIEIEIGRIVAYAGQHFEIIQRMFPQGVVHYLTIVEIAEDVGGGAVGVIISIDEVHQQAGSYLQDKDYRKALPGESVYLKERQFVDQKDKQQGI